VHHFYEQSVVGVELYLFLVAFEQQLRRIQTCKTERLQPIKNATDDEDVLGAMLLPHSGYSEEQRVLGLVTQ
jgi:hypothetical protein